MEALGQGLMQGIVLIGALGLLGLPFFVWRRPPSYYWRCPRCRAPNSLEHLRCTQCEHRIAQEELHLCLRAKWRGVDLIALYLAAQIVSFFVGIAVLLSMGRVRTNHVTPTQIRDLTQQPDIVWTFILLMSAALAILTVWALGNRYRWSLKELGLHSQNIRAHLVIGVIIGVSIFAIGALFDALAAFVPWLNAEQNQMLGLFPAQIRDPLWVLILPSVLVLNPLSGELFFRGMLYRMFRMRWRLTPALWTSAVLFSIGSGLVVPFASLLALGAANGILFERTRSLVPGIVASGTQGLLMIAWVVFKSGAITG